jgi:predicted Zn-dependent protease
MMAPGLRKVPMRHELSSEVCDGMDFDLYQVELTAEPQEPINARVLIRHGLRLRRPGAHVLMLTARDIKVRSLNSVFGFASRRKGVAVVSTARLQSPGDGALTRQRVRNVVAHEIGHLNGLRHCRGPQCVMTPAATAGEVDRRPLGVCARCTNRVTLPKRLLGGGAALMVLVLSVLAIDRAASRLASPPPDFPFS